MLKMLNEEAEETSGESWLLAFWKDFRRRFVSLLSYQFRDFRPQLALNILEQKKFKEQSRVVLTRKELELHITNYDLKRLELYSQNMVDYHLIVDLLPTLARLFFTGRIDIHLSAVQCAVLLALGLQHKTVDAIEKELELPSSQVLALFNRVIRRLVQHLNEIIEADVESGMVARKEIIMKPAKQTLEEDLREAAAAVEAEHKRSSVSNILSDSDLSQFAIQGSEQSWTDALSGSGKTGIVSIKGSVDRKRKMKEIDITASEQKKKGKKRKHKK